MWAVVFPGDGRLAVEAVPDPTPGPGQVVVEVRAAAFCGCGREPALLHQTPSERGKSASVVVGHQGAGTVVAVDRAVRTIVTGDRVAIHPYAGCGVCESCQAGWPQYCRQGGRRAGVDFDGCWAEYVAVDEDLCRRIPEGLGFDEAAVVTCSGATAFHALTRARTSALDTLLAYNVGSLGLCASALARSLGARLLVVEPDPLRQRLATELGAEVTLEGADDAVPELLDLTAGTGVDVAFDPTATELSRDQCVRSLRTWGRYCLVGEAPVGSFVPTPLVVRRQLEVLGVWSASRPMLDRALRFVQAERVPIRKAITHRMPLVEAVDGYGLYDSLKTGIVILDPLEKRSLPSVTSA